MWQYEAPNTSYIKEFLCYKQEQVPTLLYVGHTRVLFARSHGISVGP